MRVKMREGVLLSVIVCGTLLACFAVPAGAAPGGVAMQPGIARLILSAAGLEVESDFLHRRDGISRALYIYNVRGNDLVIGFPDPGIATEVPFLLTVNGEELTVKLTAAEGLQVLDGDASLLPEDVADFVECLVNNIVDLVNAILRVDIGGIIGNVLQIVGCIFQIL